MCVEIPRFYQKRTFMGCCLPLWVLIESLVAVGVFAFIFKKWEFVHGFYGRPVLKCVMLMFFRESPNHPFWLRRREPGWRPTPWRCTSLRKCSSVPTARYATSQGLEMICHEVSELPSGTQHPETIIPQHRENTERVQWVCWRLCAPPVRCLRTMDGERSGASGWGPGREAVGVAHCCSVTPFSCPWNFNGFQLLGSHFESLSISSEGDILIVVMVAGMAFFFFFFKSPSILWT